MVTPYMSEILERIEKKQSIKQSIIKARLSVLWFDFNVVRGGEILCLPGLHARALLYQLVYAPILRLNFHSF